MLHLLQSLDFQNDAHILCLTSNTIVSLVIFVVLGLSSIHLLCNLFLLVNALFNLILNTS